MFAEKWRFFTKNKREWSIRPVFSPDQLWAPRSAILWALSYEEREMKYTEPYRKACE
jgi:hypothetical protein